MLEASVSVWNKFGDLKLEAASSSILVQKTFYFMWHTDTALEPDVMKICCWWSWCK